jgi:hypothetical protein
MVRRSQSWPHWTNPLYSGFYIFAVLRIDFRKHLNTVFRLSIALFFVPAELKPLSWQARRICHSNCDGCSVKETCSPEAGKQWFIHLAWIDYFSMVWSFLTMLILLTNLQNPLVFLIQSWARSFQQFIRLTVIVLPNWTTFNGRNGDAEIYLKLIRYSLLVIFLHRLNVISSHSLSL